MSINNVNIFWFRRDLRLEDNAGLFYALKQPDPVQPVFIFDTAILSELEDRQDKRVLFIHAAITRLQNELRQMGSTLDVRIGKPVAVFKELVNTYSIGAVFFNHDYEPYARERDSEIYSFLQSENITVHHFKDQVIFEKNEVIKSDNTPYTVYTPYANKWKSQLNDFYLRSYPSASCLHRLYKQAELPLPSVDQLGFEEAATDFPAAAFDEKLIADYHQTRDFPATDGTSKLGLHLRFGTISIRRLARFALKTNATYLNELIWREFFQMILWHYPDVVAQSFKKDYDNIRWRNQEQEFEAWCKGETGYPLVDAGMRELNQTGYMHNRVRMVTASFLCKHLLIDWRWGEAYFAKKLLDYDLASNNGNWQWAAGSGCDAAPYFRVFNPTLQLKKFDPQLKYVKRWVPEFGTNKYPAPIVDHDMARKRALEVYGKALKEKVS
ncbi:MAG TPA: deoxyribodipyrimidine photo-lyase [Flavipsychrobacter sp.]|nr:deoxyribodipyrimidine photo-lyase [Flavipsychrobacter sp.]